MKIFAISVAVFLGPVFLLLDCRNFAPAQETSNVVRGSLWKREKGMDWPRMLGPNYDSRSIEVGLEKKWPALGPRLVWTQRTGSGYGNGVTAMGRWFVFDRVRNQERLRCCNAETGEELWKWEASVQYRDAYGYNDGPRCSPVVDEDRVYVFGVSGTLACISVLDGKEIWRTNTQETYHVVPNFFGVGASPLVYEDKLIVLVGGCKRLAKPFGAPTVNDLPDSTPDEAAIVAFDKRTGKEIYRVGNYLASYAAPIIAPLGGKDRCLAMVREGLFIFDPKSGRNESFFPWRANMLESVNAASPVVFDDHILISEAYEKGSAILAFENDKLVLKWKDESSRPQQLIRCHWSTPIRAGNLLFASSGRNQPDTDFRCLELFSGKPPNLNWTKRNRNRGTGLVTDEFLIWLGELGDLSLLSLDPQKYEVMAECDLNARTDPNDKLPLLSPPTWAPPVLSHGYLYLRGEDRVVCLDLMK